MKSKEQPISGSFSRHESLSPGDQRSASGKVKDKRGRIRDVKLYWNFTRELLLQQHISVGKPSD